MQNTNIVHKTQDVLPQNSICSGNQVTIIHKNRVKCIVKWCNNSPRGVKWLFFKLRINCLSQTTFCSISGIGKYTSFMHTIIMYIVYPYRLNIPFGWADLPSDETAVLYSLDLLISSIIQQRYPRWCAQTLSVCVFITNTNIRYRHPFVPNKLWTL